MTKRKKIDIEYFTVVIYRTALISFAIEKQTCQRLFRFFRR